MANYNDYLIRIKAFLRVEDIDQIDADEIDECVVTAAGEHSTHKPLIRYADIDGNGGFDYPLPADWKSWFSSMRAVEYPVGDRSRTFLKSDNYEVFNDGNQWLLRLLSATPSTTEMIRIEYTTSHQLDTSTDTILETDFSAICFLATAYCYASMAARYTGTSDPTMTSDVVNYRSKGEEYKSLERNFRQRYFQAIGGATEEKGPKPVLIVSDFDPEFANQINYLTHPNQHR